MNDFSEIASSYDKYNSASYGEYCAYICNVITCFSAIKVREMLDLGCGTGVLTRLLADSGYDMVGVDLSGDMLSVAQNTSSNGILYLNQDMREFELYGTVQATVCTFDSLNYLSSAADLKKTFELVCNYTESGGLFLFDINTQHRYESVFADNAYVYENDNDMLIWQNSYNKKSRTCHFYLTQFKNQNGAYIRSDEIQRQKFFPVSSVKKLAESCGFDVVEIYGSLKRISLEANSEKAYFVCKKR